MIGHRIDQKTRGVTLVETMLAVALLSLLFAAANSVLSYSRLETEKGFWIQQGIGQLRNGTRAITDMLKKTSYPTTILRGSSGGDKVISFKERRIYDGEDKFGIPIEGVKSTGRLRLIVPNQSKDFDMHTISDGSMLRPTFSDQTIMYFPVCEPEKDFDTGYTEGVINWVELVLKPSHNYSVTGLGSLYIIEREERYNTRGDKERAYGLKKKFDPGLAIKRSREIINDVSAIEVDSYEIEELRGIYVTDAGQRSQLLTERYLISVNISISHPKDPKIWLSDQCSVINNVQLVKVDGGERLELLQVFSTGTNGSAELWYQDGKKTVRFGDSFGIYTVTSINTSSIGLTDRNTGVEGILITHSD